MNLPQAARPPGRLRVLLYSIGGLLALALGHPASAADARVAKIGEMVREDLRTRNVPGAGVAVVYKGKVVLAEGYGLANIEHNVPVTSDTIFQTGSVGKMFTATAVMLLVEDGRLSLDEPLSTYFPGSPAQWHTIRLRNVLTHTAGLANADPTLGEIDFQKNYTEDDIVKMAQSMPLEFEPGSRWRYSNTGFELLGILVHKVSGKFYWEILKDRVFGPLGMKTARNISDADIVPHRAAAYRLINGELKNQLYISPSINSLGDGTLYLSVKDYIAWDKGIREKAILKPESWQEIFRPFTLNSGTPNPYGFGWFLGTAAGKPVAFHSGGWQSFRTYIGRYLGDDLTVVVLNNGTGANADALAEKIAALFEPKVAKEKPSPPTPEPAVAERMLALLQKASEGRLYTSDLPYAQHGFFQKTEYQGVDTYFKILQPLGKPEKVTLYERGTAGDDQTYTFRVDYANQHTVTVAYSLAPDNRVSGFGVWDGWIFDHR